MARLGRDLQPTSFWGAAEQAALERCLAFQGEALMSVVPSRPPKLSRVIEAEIIPRLMLAHSEAAPAPRPSRTLPSPAEVEIVARLAIGGGFEAVMAQVGAMRGRGTPVPAVLLHLLAPAARHLGDLWVDDLCSFTDVTIGLSCLHQVLRAVSLLPEDEGPEAEIGRILLAPVPGEQHSFGCAMLEEFFRRAGWVVRGGPAWSAAEIARAVRTEWFHAVGLSLASDVLLDRVEPLVRSIRRVSQNPDVMVMVGGRLFAENPGRVAEVGADVTAQDAPEALLLAGATLKSPLARC